MIPLKKLVQVLEADYHKAVKDFYLAEHFRHIRHHEAEARMEYINYLMGVLGMKGFSYRGRLKSGSFTIHEIVKVDENEHIVETFEYGHGIR